MRGDATGLVVTLWRLKSEIVMAPKSRILLRPSSLATLGCMLGSVADIGGLGRFGWFRRALDRLFEGLRHIRARRWALWWLLLFDLFRPGLIVAGCTKRDGFALWLSMRLDALWDIVPFGLGAGSAQRGCHIVRSMVFDALRWGSGSMRRIVSRTLCMDRSRLHPLLMRFWMQGCWLSKSLRDDRHELRQRVCALGGWMSDAALFGIFWKPLLQIRLVVWARVGSFRFSHHLICMCCFLHRVTLRWDVDHERMGVHHIGFAFRMRRACRAHGCIFLGYVWLVTLKLLEISRIACRHR